MIGDRLFSRRIYPQVAVRRFKSINEPVTFETICVTAGLKFLRSSYCNLFSLTRPQASDAASAKTRNTTAGTAPVTEPARTNRTHKNNKGTPQGTPADDARSSQSNSKAKIDAAAGGGIRKKAAVDSSSDCIPPNENTPNDMRENTPSGNPITTTPKMAFKRGALPRGKAPFASSLVTRQ